jgi:iron complex outermembrane receptor protein
MPLRTRPSASTLAHRPRPALRRISLAARAAVLGLPLGLAVLAGEAGAQSLERVEITGSSIKRIEGETALPVQVLRREDFDKAGLTTAADIVASLTAGANSLTDGMSIGTGGFRDQMGFNAANLRGIGVSSTLVLLNGRRMANFASPGDDVGVDLNTIPAAAIERVEVLLDGASAVYGSDAIGGVINFITRKNYQGVEIDAYVSRTGEGGAGKRTASIAAGKGDPQKDGYNLFGVFDVQRSDALRTSQRKFIDDLKIPERLPHLLSSAPFPGNIRLSGDQRDYLQSVGFTINGKPIVNRTINLSAPDCQPPHSLYLPLGIGGEDACTYDYMRDLELYPKSEKLSALTRGVFQLTPEHQLFAEYSYSRARTWYVGTSNRVNNGSMDVSLIPELAATGLATVDPEIIVRYRLLEAGNRQSQLTSTGSRLVLGSTGTFGKFDYDFAVNHSVNRVSDRDVHGYLLFNETMEGIANGLINPFGPSSAEGLALINSLQVNDEVRHARGTTDSIDLKTSTALMPLGGGDLTLALGAELRRETQRSGISELLASDNILGDDTPGDAQNLSNSRRASAVFMELSAPLTRELEVGGALRYDRYEKVGASTTPAVRARFQPSKEVLLRASAGTGFRAPSMSDLFRPTAVGSSATLADPVCMAANNNDLATCADIWETQTFSNPDLKPERSRQYSFGLVLEPSKQWSFSADYWAISKRDLISTIGDEVILANLDKYGELVHRDVDGVIEFIELRKENRGRQKVSGLDLVGEHRTAGADWGRLSFRLSGTLVLKSQQQTANDSPYISNLGRFVNDGVVQRWRHRVSVDWDKAAFSVGLANSYSSSYQDQNSAIDTNTGLVVGQNRVKAYSLWDLTGSWSVDKQFKLRVGIKNLLDAAPPYSNQAYFFISGYDPSYTDPRGRTFFLNAQYKF